MNFPNGSTEPDAQNDTDVTLCLKITQSTADLCDDAGKAFSLPDPQDSIYQSWFKIVGNLYNYFNT